MNPARHNILKPAQLRIDIQRQPMQRRPASNPYSNRTNLRRVPIHVHPNADILTIGKSFNSPFGQRIDHNRLELMHISADGELVIDQSNNRICHQLPRAMKCNIPPAVAVNQFDTKFAKLVSRFQEIPPNITAPPQRNHRRMLDKKNRLFASIGNFFDRTFLQRPSLPIAHDSQINNLHRKIA